MKVKLSVTFLTMYDHGIGKGMPLPKLEIQGTCSASAAIGTVHGWNWGSHTG